MSTPKHLQTPLYQNKNTMKAQSLASTLHIDIPLLLGILALLSVGFVVLYSSSDQHSDFLIRQIIRVALASLAMFGLAQISPETYRRFAVPLFCVGVCLLVLVLAVGHVGKGAQRWLNLGFVNVQPSEVMKLAIPIFFSWYLSEQDLPPSFRTVSIAGVLLIIPVLLTAKQPDLGTALLLAASGGFVILLAGLSWRYIATIAVLGMASVPALWFVMHPYQRSRVLTFVNPERDPLGSGYHIIQSKIAIGSGGLLGKGWLNGTQSHLNFLPEHSTDFIFAVLGEEFGLVGALVLLSIYFYIAMRCLYITNQAQDTFTRLLAGSISLNFFLSVFINIGMVTGILPVVGIPLPLVSYGGTYLVTLMAGFGVLMSINTHRRLLPQ